GVGLTVISNARALSGLEHSVLIRSRRQMSLASTHPCMQSNSITLKDVPEHAYIMPTLADGERSALRYTHRPHPTPAAASRSSSMASLRGLVAHGFGVTIVSDMLYRAWSLEGKKIEIRPLTDAVPPMELGLLWREGASLNEAASAFQQFLIRACGS